MEKPAKLIISIKREETLSESGLEIIHYLHSDISWSELVTKFIESLPALEYIIDTSKIDEALEILHSNN